LFAACDKKDEIILRLYIYIYIHYYSQIIYIHIYTLLFLDYIYIYIHIQSGSNMIGTNCDLFTHKSSRSYLNHLVCIYICNFLLSVSGLGSKHFKTSEDISVLLHAVKAYGEAGNEAPHILKFDSRWSRVVRLKP
jgi:hypothetical protein